MQIVKPPRARQEITQNKQLPNETNTMKKNPLIKTQKIAVEEMRKFASPCGLTIDSRLKAGTTKISKENEDIKNEFGDI